MTTSAQVESMHRLYCSLTGLQLRFEMQMLYAWELFCARFTQDDLKLVVTMIKNKARKGQPHRSFTFRNFISGPESLQFFAEDLAEAKAQARKPTRTARQSVLEASGRPEPCPDMVKSAGQVLRESEALKALLQVRDNL